MSGAGIVPFHFGINDTRILILQGISGKWGFPKGQKEPNENLKQTAIRELEEETSISISIEDLKSQSFKFGNYIFWFVKFNNLENVKIQESEIMEYKWISLGEFMKMDVAMLNYPTKLFKFGIENKRYQITSYIKQNERKFNVKVKEFVPILEPSS